MRGRFIAHWLAATFVAAAVMGASPAAARGPDNPFLGLGAEMPAPRGFAEMCGSMPALCRSFAQSAAGTGSGTRRESLADPPLFAPLWAAAAPLHVACGMAGFAELSLACRVEAREPPIGREMAMGGGGLFALSKLAVSQPDGPISHPFAPLPADAAPATPPVPAVPPPGWSGLLRRVNDRVNARVHQQSDLATYGVPELWRPSGDRAKSAGDCEDLALEKRVELIAADFPPERLFLAVVYRSDIGLHTVLVARLDEGDVVLDSRVGFIERWSRAGYSWLSAEAPGEPMVWRAVA